MNLLSQIIERLNQRIEVGNIFDQIYGLSELVGEGNDKAWAFYIGNGQAIPVSNYDAKQGTLFWAKRGKITVTKNDSLRLAGCKSIYETRFTLTAYAMVRKSHLPCDSADAQDWVASRVLRLISGTDPQFKTAIGVIAYEVVPSGYATEARYLPVNYEWAAVAIDVDVNISTSSEDGCYDTCATGDIPLPDFEPCEPCLTSVAVDGVTITGNGTPADPLVAIGGGGGTPLRTQEEGVNVSTNTTTLNFTGAGVTASLTSPGVVEVNVPGGGGGGTLVALPFSTDHLTATGNAYAINDVVYYLGNVYRCIASNDSILPTNATYWTNLGAGFPLVQQPSDWNATSGNNQILNKPTIPATIVEDVTATAPLSSSGGTTPDISITQADSTTDGYLSSADWNTFDGKFDVPTGTASDYLDGTGTPTPFPTLTNGTVTSVAATVPTPTNPAFSVTVPNNTTTPSVDITANGVVSQYVRGDGSLANFPLGGGGGASVNYYLNGSISQGTIGGNDYYEMSRVPVLGGGTNFTRTNAQGNGYIAQFITDAGDPSLLAIPSGNWTFETYFNASSGGGSPSFYIELYKYDGATFTLISSGATNPEAITGGTVVDLYVSALAVPSTVLLATDRLAIRIFVTTSGRTITLHTEDNNLCQVITTFTTGLNALNGLTAQVQNFATGTAGTDFGITSVTDTHTFNLPTASASNRGALSSGDWTTFNGKFNTPSGTTSQYVRGDGTLATFPTFPLVYKSAADTAGYQSTANTVLYTQLIPANTFAAGDIIRVIYRAKKLLTNGATTTRIYINSTANLSGSPIQLGILTAIAASRFVQMERYLVIKNSSNATEVAISSSSLNSDTVNTGNFDTLVINWTNALYFVFAFQNVSALDTNFGSMYLIEKL
jgi:hypothetical protein